MPNRYGGDFFLRATSRVALALLVTGFAHSQTPFEHALERSRELRLGESTSWTKMLHYRASFWPGKVGEVIGPEFYLSPEGRRHPQAELESDLATFFDPKIPTGYQQHPQCRFPLRFKWLREQLNLAKELFPVADCSRWEKFRQTVDAHSVTAVFSSYYLSNPSSAFGHLFLRLNRGEKAGESERSQLLDYGINFAASVDTSNAFLYGLYGLFGVFPGVFTSVPYYFKVREYNDFESRDLWEYDLNLTPEETQNLVAHLWELGPNHIPYYYLDENCATHILTAVEGAAPRIDFRSQLPWGIVVPSDAIKILAATPGVVREIHYRPSVYTQFRRRLSLMNEDEIDILKQIIRHQTLEALPPENQPASRAKVLDAAIDSVDYQYAQALLERSGGPSEWKQSLLVARASTGIKAEALSYPDQAQGAPHLAHPSSRFGIGGGEQGRRAFWDISFKKGLHELLDPPQAFPEGAEFDFFNATARWTPSLSRIQIQNFDLFKIRSFVPWDDFSHKLSWRARMGATRTTSRNCSGCLAGNIEGGGGISFRPPSISGIIVFGLAEAGLDLGSFARHSALPRVGARIGLLGHLNNSVSLLAESVYSRYFAAVDPDSAEFSEALLWSFAKNKALQIKAVQSETSSELGGSLLWYF
ncbi:MAG: DUF4105 domain-containing protein [Bdellovibrionales bacterium]|nr:DUF4105 domain-containing protein [Bdellovibrionales bacterium]